MQCNWRNRPREILGQSDLVIITERVDDVALLIGQMVKMGLVEVLDRHLRATGSNGASVGAGRR